MEYARDRLLIGGEWLGSSGGKVIEVVDPSTEQVAARVPAGSNDDIDRAVSVARDAFDHGPWPRLTLGERADVIERACDVLEPKLAEIAPLVTTEMGLPISLSRLVNTTQPLAVARFAADVARRFETVEERDAGMPVTLLREPIGVVGAIAPWNGPFIQAMYKLVYPLLAGCAVVFKPAPETPLDAFYIGDALIEAGLPPGLLSIVPGDRDLGAHLVAHPGIDKVSFTGSTAAGRRIGAVCGEQLKRVALELGGKSAAIVLDDADLDVALPGLVAGVFANSGQVCAATSRILVSRRRHDEVVDRMIEAASAIKVGDPFDEATELGPLVAERQRARVEEHIRIGRSEGARIAVGGGRPAHLPRGWYIEPTVFVEVDNGSRLAQEEVFGPVAAVIAFDDEAEAISLANASPYGLHGAVYTTDQDRAREVAAAVRTGTFTVNGFHINMEAPFGGYKDSGIGRKFGAEGLASFFELKTVNFPR